MSDTDAQTEQRSSLAPPVDRVRLEALRYAVNEESAQYIAVMRTFTGGLSGLLSDRSATEVATALAEEGIELDTDTTDTRLSYLVEHGNLARSPRETEARSLRDYLQNRARYQLTQRGELVHRQIEDLLGYWIFQFAGAIMASLLMLIPFNHDLVKSTANVAHGNGASIFMEIAFTALFVLVILNSTKSGKYTCSRSIFPIWMR